METMSFLPILLFTLSFFFDVPRFILFRYSCEAEKSLNSNSFVVYLWGWTGRVHRNATKCLCPAPEIKFYYPKKGMVPAQTVRKEGLLGKATRSD